MRLMALAGTVALVTGGNGGIGLGMARAVAGSVVIGRRRRAGECPAGAGQRWRVPGRLSTTGPRAPRACAFDTPA
jgi:NAD(P)-dependent dehydrogenase (short-subunit alcohol dehydrogenase family)